MARNTMKYLSALCALFSLNAWSQPNWVNNVKPNSKVYAGVGIGETLANAKLDATSQISSSIRSSHSYYINQAVETVGDKGEQTSYSSMQSEAKNMLLPELKWVKMEGDSGLYYVLGEVRKTELVTLYERTLAMTSNDYAKQINTYQLSFQEYLQLLAQHEDIQLAAERASIIHDQSPKGEAYYQQFVGLLKKISVFGHSNCMQVSYKGHSAYDGKTFTPMVEAALSQSRINVSDNPVCEPVTINTNSESERTTDGRKDKITLYIELGSPAVKSKTVAFYGTSSGSKKAAYSNAIEQFNRHFNKSNSLMSYLLDDSQHHRLIQ